MALNLTNEQIEKLKLDATIAEPYPNEAPELMSYDGQRDSNRMKATIAKRLLEQDAKEKSKK